MEIVLSRLRGHQCVHLFPEQNHLRYRVTVSGVRGLKDTQIKTLSEQPLDWGQVLKTLNVPVNYSDRYPWTVLALKT